MHRLINSNGSNFFINRSDPCQNEAGIILISPYSCIVRRGSAYILSTLGIMDNKMSSPDFSSSYDSTLLAIEEVVEAAMEDSETEMDYETINDILTLTCEDGTSIIITRQSATNQLWLAARSGGFHFDLVDGQWVCDSDQETLGSKLSSICHSQGGVSIDFSGAGIT